MIRNNLNAFRQFTKDPNHFNVVKDLDYFFLVFESFFGEAKPETPPKPESLPAPETLPAKTETTAATTAANPPETTAPETTAAIPPETTAAEPETTAEPSIMKKNKKQKNYNIIITQQLNML